MRLATPLCLIFTLLLFSATSAWSAEGVVVLNKSDCSSRYVVETTMGYAILEWYGGNDPLEGSRMVGDFESYGMKTIYNASSGSEARVWVEDYFLSKPRVIEKMREFCE